MNEWKHRCWKSCIPSLPNMNYYYLVNLTGKDSRTIYSFFLNAKNFYFEIESLKHHNTHCLHQYSFFILLNLLVAMIYNTLVNIPSLLNDSNSDIFIYMYFMFKIINKTISLINMFVKCETYIKIISMRPSSATQMENSYPHLLTKSPPMIKINVIARLAECPAPRPQKKHMGIR